jgi:hypothetical protein
VEAQHRNSFDFAGFFGTVRQHKSATPAATAAQQN